MCVCVCINSSEKVNKIMKKAEKKCSFKPYSIKEIALCSK